MESPKTDPDTGEKIDPPSGTEDNNLDVDVDDHENSVPTPTNELSEGEAVEVTPQELQESQLHEAGQVPTPQQTKQPTSQPEQTKEDTKIETESKSKDIIEEPPQETTPTPSNDDNKKDQEVKPES
eukprot:UN30910